MRSDDPRQMPPVDPWPAAPLSHTGPLSASYPAVELDSGTVPVARPARRRRLRVLVAIGVVAVLAVAGGVAVALYHPGGARQAGHRSADSAGGLGAALPGVSATDESPATAAAPTTPVATVPATATATTTARATGRPSAKTPPATTGPPSAPGPPRVYNSSTQAGGSLDTTDQFIQIDLEARAGQPGDRYDFGFNVNGITTIGSGRLAHWGQATPTRPEHCEAGVANGGLQSVPLSQLAEDQLYCVRTVEGRFGYLHITRIDVSSGMLIGLLFEFTLWKTAGDP